MVMKRGLIISAVRTLPAMATGICINNSTPQAIQAALLIDAAVDKVIAESKHLTADLGGKANTTQMGDAVVAAL